MGETLSGIGRGHKPKRHCRIDFDLRRERKDRKQQGGPGVWAWTSLGKSGVDSFTARPILPWTGGSGLGSTFCGGSAALS